MRMESRLIKKICSLGLSSFVMQITESLLLIVTNASLKQYGGDLYVGIMTIMGSVMQIIVMPLSGLAQGAQPVIGYNYGAKQNDRVKQGIHFLIKSSMSYSLISWLIILSAPGLLIRIFNSDPQVLEVGIPIFRTYFAAQVIMGLQLSAQQCFVALNKAKHSVFFALLRKVFLLIPMILILPGVVGLGVQGIFLAEPIADSISAITCFTTFIITTRKMLNNN